MTSDQRAYRISLCPAVSFLRAAFSRRAAWLALAVVALVLAVSGLLWPGVAAASDLPARDSASQTIPWAELVAKATTQFTFHDSYSPFLQNPRFAGSSYTQNQNHES